MTEQELPPISYPLFAPLPVPVVLHLLRGPNRSHPAAEQLPLSYRALEGRVRHTRQTAFVYMDPFVQANRLSSSWLMQALKANTPEKIPVGTQTLALWHDRGVFRYQGRGRPDIDNAAALLIARMLDRRERNWKPSSMAKEEPAWWCWRQDLPEAPIVACPVPLPADLPATALLWTPWLGSAWQNRHWLRVGDLGAIRWAHTQELIRGGRWLWALNHEALAAWCPETAAMVAQPARNVKSASDIAREIIHACGQLALFRLALSPARLLMFATPEVDLTPLGLPGDGSPQP